MKVANSIITIPLIRGVNEIDLEAGSQRSVQCHNFYYQIDNKKIKGSLWDGPVFAKWMYLNVEHLQCSWFMIFLMRKHSKILCNHGTLILTD